MKKVFLSLIMIIGSTVLHAQIGSSKIGMRTIGGDSLRTYNIGKARTALCPTPGPCGANCSIYTFIGAGNWSIDGNWEAGIKPPASLLGCVQIVINPTGNNECLLNVPIQILPPGTSITVLAGKKFRIPGKLVRE